MGLLDGRTPGALVGTLHQAVTDESGNGPFNLLSAARLEGFNAPECAECRSCGLHGW